MSHLTSERFGKIEVCACVCIVGEREVGGGCSKVLVVGGFQSGVFFQLFTVLEIF